MKTIDVEQMKQIQLDILADVADFCKKNDIRYFLSGGSMLGAVRHKGFIPWDDDIDINMPRPDYNRFIHEYKNSNYSVLCWENNSAFICSYAKVADTRTKLEENSNFGVNLGINIDIFPVDGLPKKESKIPITVKKMKTLWGLIVCATVQDISKRSRKKKIEIRVMRCFYKIFHLQSYFTGLTIRRAQKYRFDNSSKVAVLVWGYGIKEVISHKTACEYIEVPFEQYNFCIPDNYDEYLTSLYGNYMSLPPEKDRIYKHQARAYWI